MGRSYQIIVVILCLTLVACQIQPIAKRRPYIPLMARTALTGAAGGAALGSVTLLGTPLGAAIGGVAGTIIGDNMVRNQAKVIALRDELAHRGVDVFAIGEDVTMVIPNDSLFFFDSPRLTYAGLHTVKLAADYLNQYKKELIQIEAFTDQRGDIERNFALTRGQAESVITYLVAYGVDSRVLVADGHGGNRPIAPDTRGLNGRDQVNRRLEIHFRALPLTAD